LQGKERTKHGKCEEEERGKNENGRTLEKMRMDEEMTLKSS
jgi:hypothetical protein